MGERVETNEDELISRYRAALGLLGDSEEDKKRRECAFRTAHDLRKFEIELLWKRSTYLWGFQVVAFAGFAAMSQKSIEIFLQNPWSISGITAIALQLSISGFGLLTAFLWFCTARASKIWFYNWEKHIDLLEREFSGNLYRTLYFREPNRIYSLTSVNEAVAIIAGGFWAIISLLVGGLVGYKFLDHERVLFALLCVLIVVVIVFFQILVPFVTSRGPGKMRDLPEIRLTEGHFKQRPLL